MKLSISNIAWTAEEDAIMYPALPAMGFHGLEIAPTRIFPEAPYEQLAAAGEWAETLASRYGLAISSIQSIWYGHQERIFASREERRTLVDYTKKAIDFAEVIGCRNLVFGNPRNRDTEDVPGNYATAVDFFREIGDYALAHNTVIAIEANPVIYHTRFINTTQQAAEIADRCNSAGVKVNVDLGTMIYNEEDIDYLKQIPEFIHHIHISEPGLKVIERRPLHNRLFSVLKAIGYEGYVSIEMGRAGAEECINACKYVYSLLEP